jgi:citrate/tricarballylate utilization protein
MSAGEGRDDLDRPLPLTDLIAEAQRVLAICNACRYCEGYCAVFPALERRLSFVERDVHYLANLCHNCGACLYACQYAPPHEFHLNLPRVLARVRNRTYRQFAWPTFLAAAFERNGAVVASIAALSIFVLLVFTAWFASPARFVAAFSDAQGSFYALLPHGIMIAVFGAAFAFVVLVLAVSSARFSASMRQEADGASLIQAARDAATLKYLDGGGDGCTYPRDTPSFARRNFHHLTFYGFVACFAATVVATFDHYVLQSPAPYPFFSAPVVLGTIGGLSLLAGTAGLLALIHRRDPDLGDDRQRGMDVGFLMLLFVTSLTGLLLLVFRETRAMGPLLAVHLAAVLALFLTLPYGKFVHALYRFAALAQFHRERGKPVIHPASE